MLVATFGMTSTAGIFVHGYPPSAIAAVTGQTIRRYPKSVSQPDRTGVPPSSISQQVHMQSGVISGRLGTTRRRTYLDEAGHGNRIQRQDRARHPRFRAGLGPYAAPTAPKGAPNVLYLVWDDTGIATWDCFGGLVEMPAMSRIAERGVRLSQFHTTALCSPTRASLLTGRNATTVGMATIEEFTDGFPNCNGRIPADTALLSEVLDERGYNTYCVGKWHLTPLEESNLAATKRHWPLSRGFERFYGFMGGETDQWYPDLVYDNHPVAPPATPEEGYHLSKDLADKTIEFIRDAKVIAPDKPWFSYVCPGAGHAPHHVFKEWADKYAGKFDMGYERYREIVLENQKKLGIVPPDTELSPINPYLDVKGPNGEPWPPQDTVRPWESLNDEEKRLFSRMAEVFAGFLSYTDAQIGRILDYLEESGQLDNTIIVVISDNGASGEGGPNGSVNEVKFFNGYIDTVEESMRFYRPSRRPGDLQPLSDRLGDGVQHALQAVQALRLPRRRHRRHRNHLLAQRNQGARRGSRQLRQRLRHHARRSTTCSESPRPTRSAVSRRSRSTA